MKIICKLDPLFVGEHYHEHWILQDGYGNCHRVEFNNCITMPMLTEGWHEFRDFYHVTLNSYFMLFINYIIKYHFFFSHEYIPPCKFIIVMNVQIMLVTKNNITFSFIRCFAFKYSILNN